ncbi:MAG: sigma-B regulation protein RsbU (phosphoserine phosphatase) [Paraglaciecola psychrophila]|jgi:sigma-B regulation protein RsbU (phosphoserine phosphatase)
MSIAGHHILLIDHQDDSRGEMFALLEMEGYTVTAVAATAQVHDLIDNHQPDVALLDLNMPGVDCLSLLRELSSHSSDTPIIVMSADGVMNDVVQALRFGASDYLIKPIVEPEVLQHALARCIEQGRLLRQNKVTRRELEEANLRLKKGLQLLEQDQQAGRHVQFTMLPDTPKTFASYEFSHQVLPSLYLSGDFIDYFTVGDNHVTFFIADVSGHGASSAFVTVLLKNLFARKRSDFLHQDDRTILSPLKMLQVANRELLATDIGKHATLCVGTLDLNENSLLYSVAGHLPLPILVADGCSQYLETEGMPVGLFETASYFENKCQLPDRFELMLFTDGVLEVIPAQGVLAQEAFLLKTLSPGFSSLQAVTQALGLHQVVDAPDDIACLVISKSH